MWGIELRLILFNSEMLICKWYGEMHTCLFCVQVMETEQIHVNVYVPITAVMSKVPFL